MLMMRILYVWPGVKDRFAVVVSFSSKESGMGGRNWVLDVLSNCAISVGISAWYQSDVVRIVSESYCDA